MARLLVLLALLLAASVPAHAGIYDGCPTNNIGALCESEPSAVANAQRVTELLRANAQQTSASQGHNHKYSTCPPWRESGNGLYGGGVPFTRVHYDFKDDDSPLQTCSGQVAGGAYRDFLDSTACQGGYGVDPLNPTQCLTQAKCQARPQLGRGVTTGASSSTCSAGCEFKPVGDLVSISFGDQTFTPATAWKSSGAACAAGMPPQPPEKDQECRPAGAGQTFCVKPTGEQCASATNGRQFCWKPGETGEKTDGPVLQKRNAGPTEIPPNNLQLPSGDSLVKQGQSITSTTTTNSTSTSTTTTTNYTTQNGTNAGTKNEGESATGDGSGKDGEGDGKGASGGTNCETPPVVTGDQVLGMVATQAWQTRCAVEAGNAAKVTGDVGNCAQPFTVEGTNANAVQLRAMRAQLCKGDSNGDGQPDWTKPDGTEAGEGGEDEEPGILQRMVNTDLLDTDGFFGGSATCPQLGSLEMGPFGSFSFDDKPWFCDLVALMRGVVLLMGAFISLRILTGEGL